MEGVGEGREEKIILIQYTYIKMFLIKCNNKKRCKTFFHT